MRGGAAWKLVGLITQRSLVQIQAPLPNKNKGLAKELTPYFFNDNGKTVLTKKISAGEALKICGENAASATFEQMLKGLKLKWPSLMGK